MSNQQKPKNNPGPKAAVPKPLKRPSRARGKVPDLLPSNYDKSAQPLSSVIKRNKGYLAKAAKQIILPDSVDQPIVLPSEHSAQLCSRRIRKVVDVNVNSHFRAVMSPDISAPGFYSDGATPVLIPSAGTSAINGVVHVSHAAGASTAVSYGGTFTAVSTGETALILSAPVADTSAPPVTHDAIAFTLANGQIVYFVAKNTSNTNNAAPALTYYAFRTDTNVWVQLGNSGTLAQGVESKNFWAVPAACSYIAIGCSDSSTKDTSFTVDISATGTLSGSGTTSLGGAFNSAANAIPVLRGRVTAMSMLVTNTTALLNRGGNVMGARLDRQALYGAPDWNQVGSVLPANRFYSGDGAKGCYMWWCWKDTDEFSPNELDDMFKAYKKAEVLATQLDTATPQTLRVTFDYIFEFYTPSQLYEKVQTPMITEEWRSLERLIQTIPAASCNPEHYELFRQALRSAINGAQQAYGFYDKHRELINTLAPMLISALGV